MPRDDPDHEVVILEIEYPDDPERESYINVENENVLNAVFQIFKEKYKDEFADKDVLTRSPNSSMIFREKLRNEFEFADWSFAIRLSNQTLHGVIIYEDKSSRVFCG